MRSIPKLGKKVHDVGLPHRGRIADPPFVEELPISLKVAAIGAQRVGGCPTFDPQVVQPSTGRTFDERAFGQRSTSSRVSQDIP